jgi:hypothetical protein
MMRSKFSPRAALSAILAILWLVASAAGAAGQAGAIVRPDPVSLGLVPGAEGTLKLVFENVTDLYGLEVHLSFDPTIVEVVDADASKPGVQILTADWLKGAFVPANQADNVLGKIEFAATLLNPAPPVSGSNSFATVTFKAKQNGASPVKIDKVILATRDAAVIESLVRDGVIGVSALGNAPSPIVPTVSGFPTASTESGTSGSGRTLFVVVVIACLSILAFLAAVGVLVYVVRARRRQGR